MRVLFSIAIFAFVGFLVWNYISQETRDSLKEFVEAARTIEIGTVDDSVEETVTEKISAGAERMAQSFNPEKTRAALIEELGEVTKKLRERLDPSAETIPYNTEVQELLEEAEELLTKLDAANSETSFLGKVRNALAGKVFEKKKTCECGGE